jgi:CHAT domain-containing protein
VLRSTTDPRGAIASLDGAVAFFEKHGKGLQLPDAYLQRARARRATGDETGALSDYHAALREVAKQKAHAGEVREPFLDTAGEIIDDLVALHLARGDVADAFVIADRAHAMLASSSVPVVARGIALLEYAVLPRTTVIFCVTADGIAASAISVDRRTLGERAASLAHKIRGGAALESIRVDAAALHGLLIAPVARRLSGIDEIVIVTGRRLHALPFAVLYDTSRGRHLIEDYVIRFAPSAQTRGISARAMKPAVVIADPDTKSARLQYSRDEAEKVAAMHAATLVTGKDATRQRFIDAVQRSALVHYAGHADSDLQSYGALLLAESNGDLGLLGASDIERLDLREHAPLVVLSACGTFRGTASHVAGMPSLARAFLKAGAREVVGTLWEVDDDLAAQLFLRFHDHLVRSDAAPARALRAAQIEMLQSSDPRLRHPSTWSAVEVLSDI